MKKKTLTILIAVVLVVVCAIGGTLAWLTAQSDEVVNTFTAGDINITLAETDSGLDKDNNTLTNEYKMVPGYTISKDPKVTVATGSEKCYLFVEAVESDNFDNFLEYTIATGWTPLDGVLGVYYRTVDSTGMGTPIEIISGNTVSVKTDVTKEDLNSLDSASYPTLSFKAYAVQYMKDKDTPFTAAEAWSELPTTTP